MDKANAVRRRLHSVTAGVTDESTANAIGSNLAEFEGDLVNAVYAFHRWIARAMVAARLSELSAIDALVLQQVACGAGSAALADLSFVLNIEDTHIVAYALRKLVSRGIVQTERRGKEVMHALTPLGEEYVRQYEHIRRTCLLAALPASQINFKDIARDLREMSGRYDHAARAASSL